MGGGQVAFCRPTRLRGIPSPGSPFKFPYVLPLTACTSLSGPGVFSLLILPTRLAAEIIEADLLVVGGSESACAAAIQAARAVVKKIVLVNDIDWLGGQFSAEGVGCPDEWTMVRGKPDAT